MISERINEMDERLTKQKMDLEKELNKQRAMIRQLITILRKDKSFGHKSNEKSRYQST